MVRFAKTMRSTKFQQSMQTGIALLVRRMERRVVPELPASVEEWQGQQKTLFILAGGAALPQTQSDLILMMFNGHWQSSREQWESGCWTHWCNGCCPNEEVCKQKAQQALEYLFMSFPSEPLLYRWKHWEPFLEYCLLGVTINGFLKFLVNACAQNMPADVGAWDEDDPSLSFADKQAVRLGKVRTTVLDANFQAILFKAVFAGQPLRSLMDDVSYVETIRERLLLLQKGVKLSRSKADLSPEKLRSQNWGFFSGQRAQQTLKEYTDLLHTGPDLTDLTGTGFVDLFPLVLRGMTDAYRRLFNRTTRLCYKLLAVFDMTLDDACAWIGGLWKEYRNRPCCLDPQFSKARVSVVGFHFMKPEVCTVGRSWGILVFCLLVCLSVQ
ncbi:unnamed protein product [Symbiodinium necroappetens]|uniref:Uncharacterized protein n=1 Tax=Symbiodinium necroappetens TaxID=1628268 RepID=A0A812SWA3_9DINO|nr:unnamed protein product [Symbiodinium necroappetens]